MKKTYKIAMAKMLIAVLAAGLLGGCQRQAKNPEGETAGNKTEAGQESSGTKSPSSEEGTGIKGTAAMGRYSETEVELPKEAKDQALINLVKGEDGNLELYTITKDSQGRSRDAFRYRYQEGSWVKDENWPGDEIVKEHQLDLFYVTYGLDGFYYLGGVDEDYRYHVLKLEEDNTAVELTGLFDSVFKPKEGYTYGTVPAQFEILENGNLIIYDCDQVYLCEPSGSRRFSMVKDFSGSTDDARGFVEGDEFVTFYENKIVRYNLNDGKIAETIDCDEIDDNRSDTRLFGDGAGGIYTANEKGLSHINKGGTLWEVMIDGSLNHMGMRSLYMKCFLEGDEGDYYGVFVGDGGKGIRLFHYEYDPDMEANPPITLTVYSMKDHSTVRQAISQFQSDHPEVKVEIRITVENGGAVTEEMIQGLNTELLGGKGADVLILDDLPADSYIEKGILMDLSNLVNEIEEPGDMMNNFLEGFREEDGRIYRIPARVGFPLVVGKPEAIQAYSSLRAMAGYQGEKPLIGIDNYENLLRKISRLCYEELFGQEMYVKERDILIRYLESVKAIGESNGTQTAFTQAESEEKMVTNHVSEDGLVGTGAIDYDRGDSDSGVERLDGFGGLGIPAEVRNKNPGSVMTTAGNIYFPCAIVGINRSTANEEMAKEFIRCLLSYEVQKEELYDGFPVNREALEFITQKTDKDTYSEGVGYPDGYHISANYPSRALREEAAAMMEALTVPAVVDETVMTMIVEGSKDYFDGNKTVEQAADEILRKLSVYLAE